MKPKQERANARAREAGFRNDYEYRKARAGLPKAISGRLAKAPGLSGRSRREIAAMHYFGERGKGSPLGKRGEPGGGVKLPPRGSKARARYFGRLAGMLRARGINPGPILKAIGSPKRKRGRGR